MGDGLSTEVVRELAGVFQDRESARNVLDRAGFTAHLRPWEASNALSFWAAVSRSLADGVMPDGRVRLLEAARALYPANPVFVSELSVGAAGPGAGAPSPVVSVGSVSMPMARSAYLEQVRQIAPPRLVDREAQLARLAEFCTAPDDAAASSYMWWRAAAWTGKSALMSSFVLDPPPEVRVVSFFITARYAGNSDRAAFVDVVTEQLAELLGESVPPFQDPGRQERLWFKFFADAAAACQSRGQRLVLIVDGLDEDRGVTRPGAQSIAGLLPASPPHGARVVVAGARTRRSPRTCPRVTRCATRPSSGHWSGLLMPPRSGLTCRPICTVSGPATPWNGTCSDW